VGGFFKFLLWLVVVVVILIIVFYLARWAIVWLAEKLEIMTKTCRPFTFGARLPSG
jgi:hypothetical protein